MAVNGSSHSGLAAGQPAVAVAGRDLGGDRLQVVARIEPGRDLHRLAQGLAVAQVQRAGERLDLRAAVVDVVFAGDGKAGMAEHRRQRVAEHGAAAVADMQRPGRVGRAELDVDRPAAPDLAAAIVRPGGEHGRHLPLPESRAQAEVDEAGGGHRHARDLAFALQRGRQLAGQRHGRLARGLGQDQGGIGRGLAVAGVARRIDGDAVQLELGRQAALRLQRCHGRVDQRQKLAERVHVRSRLSLNRRSCSSSAKRSVMPAM